MPFALWGRTFPVALARENDPQALPTSIRSNHVCIMYVLSVYHVCVKCASCMYHACIMYASCMHHVCINVLIS